VSSGLGSDTVIEPNGPLPAGVYWRRRAVAVLGSVLAVVVLAWLIGGLVGAGDDHPVRGTGAERVAPAPSSPPPGSRPTTTPSTPSTTSSGPAAATARASVTGPPTRPPTTSRAAPPGPPKACPDAVVKVTARPAARSNRLGSRPLLRLYVTNAGRVPCVRDVDRKLREMLIFSGDGRTRLWSSNDCYSPPEPDRRVLAPGRSLVFELRWAGRTSAPGCPRDRRQVPPGSYRLVGKLGRLAGGPVPLVLTP
jgi:hypothetical protein